MKEQNPSAEPIIKKIEYWKNYNGTGDAYRRSHDMDCILTGGNLYADTIFSLWLPLRYTLSFFEKERFGRWRNWGQWKKYESDFLKPKRFGLKGCKEFLDDLADNIEEYIDFKSEVGIKLSLLFELGSKRCNVMVLPYRRWNSKRGGWPYFDYLPAFLYDAFDRENNDFLRGWIEEESLQPFFKDGNITKENVRDLAGTGSPARHNPSDIKLETLLTNYTGILEERKNLLESLKSA